MQGAADLVHALAQHPAYARMSGDLRLLLSRLPELDLTAAAVRAVLDMPERLAEATGRHVLVAWDEFQELAALSSGRRGFDPFPLMRSRWQHHRRVGYVVSGSERSTLLELATSSDSPFFQHFELMELGPFRREDAVRLWVELAPPDTPIPAPVAQRAYELLGGHPFYLQLLGEELIREPQPLRESALKAAVQRLLFSRTGVRYLERLGDAVEKTDDGRYRLSDPVFGRWLAWRRPGGTAIPMRLLGDDAEQAVATAIARLGFELVYQSRGSRGGFDLLALRGIDRLGVQVKRARLPLALTTEEWARLEADGDRYGWRWVVAVAHPEAGVRYLDPAQARVRKTVRLHEEAVIANLLLWLQSPGAETL